MDKGFKYRSVEFADGSEAIIKDLDNLHIFVQVDGVAAVKATSISAEEHDAKHSAQYQRTKNSQDQVS